MRIFILLLLLCQPALARSYGPTTACKSNLKNIATALEMWSSDHHGHYPRRLDVLVPTYLNALPTCPAANSDTYSLNFRSWRDPDTFALCCTGDNHSEVEGRNHPAYSAERGQIGYCTNRKSPQECRIKLQKIGAALQEYRRKTGAYPQKLDMKNLPRCSFGEFVYHGQGKISCPDCAHIARQRGFYQPQWTPENGLSETCLKVPPERPRSRHRVGLIFSLSFLIILWSVRPRPRP